MTNEFFTNSFEQLILLDSLGFIIIFIAVIVGSVTFIRKVLLCIAAITLLIMLARHGFAFAGLLSVLSMVSLLHGLFLVAMGLSERYQTRTAQGKLLFGSFAGGLIAATLSYFVFLQNGPAHLAIEREMQTVLLPLMLALGSISLVIVLFRIRNILRVQPGKTPQPSVSLAIPARNETHALSASLDVSLDTTYSKLEILVLDDCSSDRTPAIIKGFAQNGVRFIQGTFPTADWLGKTHAYQQLLKHSSGDFILFAGVDVAISRTGISETLAYMQQKNLQMISIAPQRLQNDFWSNALQTMRYFGQLALPRPFSALSSVWLIKKSALLELGGFTSYRASLQPERHIAKHLDRGAYAFILSSRGAYTTRKKASSQAETLIRTAYPAVGSSAISVMLIVLFAIVGLYTFVSYLVAFNLLAIVALALFVLSYSIAAFALTTPLTAIVSTALLPITLLAQLLGLLVSMIRYELGHVGWKDRNVCIPVLNQKAPSPRPGQ